jgi:predicted CXXCH cytochrome family protein
MLNACANAFLAVMCFVSLASAQTLPTGDVLGAHDFGNGTGGVKGPNANACIYCHAPHNADTATPLWNQTLSTQAYGLYSSDTAQNPSLQPSVNRASLLCLSCHDGSVAVGQTLATGTLKMTGTMTDVVGTKLQGSHPFSLQTPIKDAASLVSTVASAHTTKDAAVKLIDNNVECSSCHDVHNQYKDKRNQNFLVRDNTGGALCMACHETTQTRTVNGRNNSLVSWTNSIHAKSTVQVATKASLGFYSTVSEYACSSCHVEHNATGAGLLRKNPNRPALADDTSQSCFTCHDGSDNLATPIANILADLQKTGHPYADSSNVHTIGEAVVLDRNRHATCADCHHPHESNPTTSFSSLGEVRPSQTGVPGVRVDGTVTQSVVYQYENCLRCHASSLNKQSLPIYGYMPARSSSIGDPLNVLAEMSLTAGSAHPVMRDAVNVSQPSLLKFMWDVSGTIQNRPMSSRIFCTDCHNSDNNREFGGTGPNGPHGSKNTHILERRYEFSQVAAGTYPAGGPGSPIINPIKNPLVDPSSGGPYSLCAKCHDLSNVLSDVSFKEHSRHVRDLGVSCSVCHSGHGVPAGASTNGKRLINFDLNVVAPSNGVIAYTGSGCTLLCHGQDHSSSGAAAPAKVSAAK